MRELLIYWDPDGYDTLTYDQEKDSSSEEAMWKIDKILYDLKPGDDLHIFCVS